MASGTAVVATPNGGAEEVLGAGQFGRIAQDHQLGGELVRLLNDNVDRDDFRMRGLDRAKEYRIDLIAERYEALYGSLLRGGDDREQPVNMAAAT
jgi:glycosyltransferase involved in cell wall biosynthesis